MGITKYKKLLFSVLFVGVFLPNLSFAGVPEVNNIMVTDVTTRSFSVIWAASEASTADIEVYLDVNGTIPLSDLVVTPHPVESGDATIRTLAEDQGVMKVRVSGLDANTSYYFRTVTTSKSTSDITYYPDAVPLMEVATESSTVRTTTSGSDEVPFSNDLIIEPCYLEDGTTPAEGTLLMATVKGGHHPITAFVGDGIELPYAMIDLNNMFSRDTFENLDLVSGENLTLLNFRGLAGNSIVTYRVPQDQSLCELDEGDLILSSGWNMLSIQLEPTDPTLDMILSILGESVDSIWTYDSSTGRWYSYDSGVPPFLVDLEGIHSSNGYWFVMNSDASIKINGDFMSSSKSLEVGWNLVGSHSIESIPLMEAIDSIYENIDSIWTYDNVEGRWYSFDKDVPYFLNDLEYIEPGKAYWFVMNQSCEW